MTEAETQVTVRLAGRRATIEAVQEALDVLRAEGIPDTFEVSINQSEDRAYSEDVLYKDRPVEHLLVVHSTRVAKRTGAKS